MTRNSHPIYINAMGMINALGVDNEQVLKHLMSSSQHNVVLKKDLVVDREVFVAEVDAELPAIAEHVDACQDSRNNRILNIALKQIEDDVRALIEQHGKDRIAVVMGTSTSGILETENALQYAAQHDQFPDDYHYSQQEMGAAAEFIQTYFDLKNISLSVSTACSSSGKVFSTARDLIHSGFCDAAIVGGADSLCRMTVNGFSSLESVSSRICNPFSQNRDGITIGEGAALFILSKQPAAVQLCGIGESSDAFHMSAPEPTGKGAEIAIRAALNDAGFTSDDIDYINLHGTATMKNDEMETAVIHRIFGANTPCSSTKPLTGHTLGAAGATEIGLCYLLLTQDAAFLPQHIWDQQSDPNLAEINLVGKNTPLAKHQHRRMMSNSFAFGGSNISVILQSNVPLTEGAHHA